VFFYAFKHGSETVVIKRSDILLSHVFSSRGPVLLFVKLLLLLLVYSEDGVCTNCTIHTILIIIVIYHHQIQYNLIRH